MKKLFSQTSMERTLKAVLKLGILQDWVRNYLWRSESESSKDTFFWIALFIYEFGDFVKQVVYRHSLGRWNKEMATEAFGEALVALMCAGEKAGVDISKGVEMTMKKYNEQEWRTKKRGNQ